MDKSASAYEVHMQPKLEFLRFSVLFLPLFSIIFLCGALILFDQFGVTFNRKREIN